MKNVVLLPAAVLAVLGAFGRPCYQEAVELTAEGSAFAVATQLAADLTAQGGVRISATGHDSRSTASVAPTGLALTTQPQQADDLVADLVAVRDLVFVTHPHRTIDGLTTEQVADLFQGKLTNWRQLGGPDAEIQILTNDSLAPRQVAAMCGLEPNELVPAGNCGSDHRCERLVAANSFAIGCMSATAALQAIEQGAPIKLLAIDGLLPKATRTGARYPLQQSLYVQFPAFMANIGAQLVRYLGSDAGLATLRDHGFVPHVHD